MKRLTEGEEKRHRVRKHNSFFGHAQMMKSQCEAIIHAPTTSIDTKNTARRIFAEASELIKQLKTRIDK